MGTGQSKNATSNRPTEHIEDEKPKPIMVRIRKITFIGLGMLSYL
jgi:hypothetical protein